MKAKSNRHEALVISQQVGNTPLHNESAPTAPWEENRHCYHGSEMIALSL